MELGETQNYNCTIDAKRFFFSRSSSFLLDGTEKACFEIDPLRPRYSTARRRGVLTRVTKSSPAFVHVDVCSGAADCYEEEKK